MRKSKRFLHHCIAWVLVLLLLVQGLLPTLPSFATEGGSPVEETTSLDTLEKAEEVGPVNPDENMNSDQEDTKGIPSEEPVNTEETELQTPDENMNSDQEDSMDIPLEDVIPEDSGNTEEPADAPKVEENLPGEEEPATDTESEQSPSSEVLEDSQKEEESPKEFSVLRGSEFTTEPSGTGVKIIGWTGSGTDLVIPDEIDAKPVVGIGAKAFQRKGLQKVTLGKNVKTIEEYAFDANAISSLIIPHDSALTTVGNYAFLGNKLSSLSLPGEVTSIGIGAFSGNQLTSLSLNDTLQTISDSAFEYNNLFDVTIGESVTSFGKKVFAGNRRFVRIATDNPVIPKLEKVAGIFGHVVNPIVIKVVSVDKETKEEISSPQILGEDMTDENNIYVLHQEMTYTPAVLQGYVIDTTITFTPDTSPYTLTLEYQSTKKPPVIERIKLPEVPINTSEDQLEGVLRSFIKATDLLGEDITSSVVIDKGDLDPSISGPYSVLYKVTDRFGNSTELSLSVMVGTDWNQYPIGGGWVLGDFTYSGSTLTGLSKQGSEKLAAMPEGERTLVLPPFSPIGSRPVITTIGASAFSYKNLIESVDFGNMKDLLVIREAAFIGCYLQELINFHQLVNLTSISDRAFQANKLASMSFDGLKSLTTIGNSAFRFAQIENVDFSGAPLVRTIGDYAFTENRLTSVDISPLTSLVSIGSYAFQLNKITSLHFGELSAFTTIGQFAFENQMISELDLSGLPSLKTVGGSAFRKNNIQTLNLSNVGSLEVIGTYAFANNNLESVDLSEAMSLKELSNEAFSYNYTLQEVTFGSIPLETIGVSPFTNSALLAVDLSGLCDLVTIGDSAFSIKSLLKVDFPKACDENMPKLQTIGKKAFFGTLIGKVELADLPYLSSIGLQAFSENRNLSEVTISNTTSLTTVESKAFEKGIISQVLIDNAPQLTELPVDVFWYNPGSPDYNDLVVVWVTPKEENKIPSKSNYVVNPDLIVETEWNPSDFTYAVIDGVTTVTGFTETGSGKVVQGKFPVVFPQKDPQGNLVESIGNNAFYQSGIAKLDLSQMTGLKTIGTSAFADNKMESVNLSNLKQLTLIGERAFYSNLIEEVNFDDLFRVTDIGASSFAFNNIKAVDFSPMESMKEIKTSAFENNYELGEIVFGNLPNLRHIGGRAFGKAVKSAKVPEVDLSGLSNLYSIGERAFANTGIENLNLRGLTTLTSIGKEAFSLNNIDSIDFSDLLNLTSLESKAFSYNSGLTYLNLRPLKKITKFSGEVFSRCNISIIEFGDLPNIITIESRAFYGNKISNLYLNGMPNLTTIQTEAFSNNQLESIKFPMEGKLTKIDQRVFEKNHLREVDFPESVKTLFPRAFRDNDPDKDKVFRPVVLRTPSRTNPNNLANDITLNEGGHIINPSVVTLKYVIDGTTTEIAPSVVDYVADLQTTSKTYYAPDIGGYYPREGEIQLVYQEGKEEYEVVFNYLKKDYSDLPGMGVHIDHKNVGNWKKHVGEILTTQVTVDASSAEEDLENAQLVINFDPKYVDITKIKIPSIPGVMNVEIKEEGVIVLDFVKIVGADYFQIPIEWAFKKGATPQDFEQILHTELRSQTGEVLAVPPLDENSYPTFPKIGAFYYLPILRKGAPDANSSYDPQGYLGGLREGGSVATAQVNGETVEYIETPVDVPFSFYVGQTEGDGTLERQIEKIVVQDTLPKYKAYDEVTGKIVEKTAFFDPVKNPAWTYDSATETVVYQKSINGGLTVNPLPRLLLQFPHGVTGQNVENSVQTTLIPWNKPESEADIVLSDTVRVQFQETQIPIPSPGITTFRKKALSRNFYDLPVDKEATFFWNISFVPSLQDQEEGKYYTNLVFTDKNLDPRMYYHTLQLPSKLHVGNVLAYDKDMNLVEMGETADGKYTFKRKDIDYFEVNLGNIKVNSTYTLKVSTKMRDPESVHYSENTSENSFRNCAHVKGDIYDKTDVKISEYISGDSCDSVVINPVKLSIVPYKDQSYPLASNSGNSTVTGDQGYYQLYVKRYVNNSTLQDPRLKLPLKNFRMVDLLPKGMMLTDSAVELSPEFARSEGADYEIVYNYKDERTAVIFTADTLNPDVEKVGKINTAIDLFMESGIHTNDVYMAFNQEESPYEYGSSTEGFDLGDSYEYMHHEVSLRLLKADFMQARKYIRRVRKEGDHFVPTTGWSDQGVTTESGGYFQYMLYVDNNTDFLKTGNQVYDVLPYINDSVIQYNNQKQRSARDSEFSNTLVDVNVYGSRASEYKVEYTNTPIKIPDGMEAGVYLRGLNWSETMGSGSTAFRVLPKDGEKGAIPPREHLSIIATMKAPESTTALYGKRANNSFVRHDDQLPPYFLEANIVYNEIPLPKGTLKLRKISDTKDVNGADVPVEGAEFTLFDFSGRVVRKGVTDSKGELSFTEIPIDGYILEETKVPENYTGEVSLRIEKGRWIDPKNLSGGVYVYDLKNVRNQPVYHGKVLIEKKGSNQVPLGGIEFELRLNQSPYTTWKKKTDRNGLLTFENLPEGNYQLTEIKSIGLLKVDRTVRRFGIVRPDQVVEFKDGTAIKNEKADVNIYKIGLLTPLNPELSLASYSAGSGKSIVGPWNYTLYEAQTDKKIMDFMIRDARGTTLSNLTTGVLYRIVENSGPENTIYKLNKKQYTFQISAQGRLLDEEGKTFTDKYIYFPNEKKDVRGEVKIVKVDENNQVLEGAEFTLYKFNEESASYESTNISVRTNEQGEGRFLDISPGRYEIRETKIPPGYSSTGENFRFVVEQLANEKMAAPDYDLSQPEHVIRKWEYTSVNNKLELNFVKKHPIADLISEEQADAIINDPENANKGYVKVQNGFFWDVYAPISGVTFDFYEVVLKEDGSLEDQLIQKDMVTDAQGKLKINEISNFILKADGVYKFQETKAKDENWILNTRPVVVRMKDYTLKPGFDGKITVYKSNYPKSGSILLSKYDRYNQERLEGITFALYKGTLEEVRNTDGTYKEELMVVGSKRKTDENGFISYRNLPLGTYVLVELETLTDQGYILFDEPEEITLNAEKTGHFTRIYNMQDRDYFDLPIEKVWYGEIPDYEADPTEPGLVVKLYQNGEEMTSERVILTGPDWKHTWKKLLKVDENDDPYIYHVEEVVPEGYRHKQIGTVGIGGVIQEGEKVLDHITLENYKLKDVTVKKVWEDDEDTHRLRPESVRIQLQRGELTHGEYEYENYLDPVDIKAGKEGLWEYTFKDLQTYDERGEPYLYRVVENPVNGYTSSYSQDGLTVTNTLQTQRINVQKVWDDRENVFNLRPESITLQLYQNEKEFLDPVVIEGDEYGWGYVFDDLPAYDKNGEPYRYTVKEIDIPAYMTDYSESEMGVVITNKLALKQITIEKIWDDFENIHSLRPEKISVQILQNGENFKEPFEIHPDDEGNWQPINIFLPMYGLDGQENIYTLKEENVPGYTHSYSEDGLTVTNTLELTQLEVTKVWDDQDNVYELRPENITLLLKQNDKVIETVTVKDEEGEWKHTFTNLPKFNKDGELYDYTVSEKDVPGYIYGYEKDEQQVVITNSLMETDITVRKVWQDQDNNYGLRPTSITLQLKQNGENFLDPVLVKDTDNWKYTFEKLPKVDGKNVEYAYTVEEIKVNGYTTTYSQDTLEITNTLDETELQVTKVWEDEDNLFKLRPESITLQLQQNGKDFLHPVTVGEGENWKHTFTKLPKYDSEGKEYQYRVSEDTVNGYETKYSQDGKTLTNTLLRTEVSITKVWDDQNNVFNLRPGSITVQLLQNGVNFLDPVTVKEDGKGEWKHTFTNLPKTDKDGRDYIYQVKEEEVYGYDTLYSPDGLTVTNRLDRTDVTVSKVWEDQDNLHEQRAKTITVQLLQNGKEFLDPVEVKKESNWEYTFVNLPRVDGEGNTYVYSAREILLEGYETSYSENGLTITNKLMTTDVTVSKIWDDRDNVYKLRPQSITLQLQQNGEDILEPVLVGEKDNWEYTFANLPKLDKEGRKHVYTVKEGDVKGYETIYAVDGLTITNRLLETDVAVHKVWEDRENINGLRPKSITLQLQQNGRDFLDSVLVKDTDNWKYTFKNLPKFDSEGREYVYSVKEEEVMGYETLYSVDGLGIMNRLLETRVTVVKVWKDRDDLFKLRPKAVTLQLQQNGKDFSEPVLVKDTDNWTYTFDNLPKFDSEGREYVYTVKEEEVKGYETFYSPEGLTVTNKLKVTEVTVTKVWEDEDNKDQLRPDEIKVQLKQNGEYFLDPFTLKGEWTLTIKDLPRLDKEGRAYLYSAEEIEVGKDYEVSYSSDGLTITNTLKTVPMDPEKPTPIDPEKPVPVDPEKPTPIDPEKPTPVDPEKPTPIDPEKPTPVDPEKPTPMDPEKPTPSKPDETKKLPNTGSKSQVATMIGLMLLASGLLLRRKSRKVEK